MSLHYDIRNCIPPTIQDVNDSCNLYVLCLILMVAGIGVLTEENLDEVYARVHAIERSGDGSGYRLATNTETGITTNLEFTKDEIRRFIGMKTNIAYISNRKFWRKFKRVRETK